ncbi:aminoglycoside phosphotransferase family protein [Kribbella albertanoniae]|uniref:aminoglycoside phosphotransferase family protein n=1 Tax=Kribbella albertanoniae TaxID=1266829 RepID=UPI0030846305
MDLRPGPPDPVDGGVDRRPHHARRRTDRGYRTAPCGTRNSGSAPAARSTWFRRGTALPGPGRRGPRHPHLSRRVGPGFQRWQNEQIAAFGVLLRAFHDATRSAPHRVICHHDPGPNNTIFRDNLPVALIDFDTAEPGSPLEDLGYAAWTWCIASKHNDPTRQAAQVRVLADAYGLTQLQRGALVDAILERQSRNVRFWTETTAQVTPQQRADRITWSRQEHAFTTTNRHTFDTHLH